MDKDLAWSIKCANLFKYYEAKYRLPKDLLYSMALRESGKTHQKHNIMIICPWTVNIEGKSYYFNDKNTAVEFVIKAIQNGKKSIDVGCLQVNLKYHPNAFKNLEKAFDPSTNIDYAAQILKAKYDKFQNWDKAVAHYHSATPELGNRYHKHIMKISANIDNHKNKLEKLIKIKGYKSYSPAINKMSLIKTQGLLNKKQNTSMMVYIPRKKL
ncbi:MAG: transglycosylase SLT domain-containing protein [Rickettsiaceae bacterium]|nr:transglycosylase SLT domain-containing protein [Rickettsiaceae bacterium]